MAVRVECEAVHFAPRHDIAQCLTSSPQYLHVSVAQSLHLSRSALAKRFCSRTWDMVRSTQLARSTCLCHPREASLEIPSTPVISMILPCDVALAILPLGFRSCCAAVTRCSGLAFSSGLIPNSVMMVTARCCASYTGVPFLPWCSVILLTTNRLASRLSTYRQYSITYPCHVSATDVTPCPPSHLCAWTVCPRNCVLLCLRLHEAFPAPRCRDSVRRCAHRSAFRTDEVSYHANEGCHRFFCSIYDFRAIWRR